MTRSRGRAAAALLAVAVLLGTGADWVACQLDPAAAQRDGARSPTPEVHRDQ